MADLLGAVFNSYLDTATDFSILAYSFLPRTDKSGTHGSITLKVQMGPAAQVLTHASNRAYGRQVTGTVNGHSIGTHVIKPYNTVAWEADGEYTYTIEFDIPYSPGTVVPVVLRITKQTGTTGALACFDTGKGWTIDSDAGLKPEAASVPVLDAAIVGALTGELALSWTAAAAGDGPVQGYDVYYSYDNLNWKHLLRTANLYAAIPLSKFRLVRGASAYLNVAAYGYYGSGPLLPAAVSFKLAEAPAAPTASTLQPAIPFGAPVTLAWSGATTPDGTISGYRIQVSRLAKGSSSWSNWVQVADAVATEEWTTTPSAYTNWTVALGDQFRYRIFAINSYGQISPTGLESGIVQIRNGIMRAKTEDVIVSGIPWIKVNGVWRKSSEVYVKVAGIWRTGK